jgi:hypothetical protein
MIYVNNRLEGSALETIDAMLERVAALGGWIFQQLARPSSAFN